MRTIPTSDDWVICEESRPKASHRLFCIPYAGGGASVFTGWSQKLPSSIEVCVLQLPGREARFREPPYCRMEPLIQALSRVLKPYLNIPFAIFGYSLGALVGFELTRSFRRLGYPTPAYLFVSACRAPQRSGLDSPIHQLPEKDFIQELRRLNGTSQEVLNNLELMRLMLPMLRADFAIYEQYTYIPGELLDVPISAFRGLEDSKVSHSDLEAWGEQTCNIFSLRNFPGNHFFLHDAQAQLVVAISKNLKQLSSEANGG